MEYPNQRTDHKTLAAPSTHSPPPLPSLVQLNSQFVVSTSTTFARFNLQHLQNFQLTSHSTDSLHFWRSHRINNVSGIDVLDDGSNVGFEIQRCFMLACISCCSITIKECWHILRLNTTTTFTFIYGLKMSSNCIYTGIVGWMIEWLPKHKFKTSENPIIVNT